MLSNGLVRSFSSSLGRYKALGTSSKLLVSEKLLTKRYFTRRCLVSESRLARSQLKFSPYTIRRSLVTERTSLDSKTDSTTFKLPRHYVPNGVASNCSLLFIQELSMWLKSLNPDRLKQLQDELVELMVPSSNPENFAIKKASTLVKIDDQNHINEVTFEIINDTSYQTKHIVFIHGYGASLGCFARNFQLINHFKDKQFNYKVHFLDNLTFGLSSNPKLQSENANKLFIKQCPPIKIIDSEPSSKLYNKYYKLTDGYEVDVDQFRDYQNHYKPILQEMEDFYTAGIDKWRKSLGIDQIDYLIGHSFGGYWSGSYAVRYPTKIKNLILLSPVGVERHVHAVTNEVGYGHDKKTNEISVTKYSLKPSLDPSSYHFLSRLPILSLKSIQKWYFLLPFVPRYLKAFGPWGFNYYFKMWFPKLQKINKIIDKKGGPAHVFSTTNDLVYGTKRECVLIIEYLYNSITNGTNSDLYVKNLLTPATVSKWPLYDKFDLYFQNNPNDDSFNVDVIYGQYDFMNAEAGEKLVQLIDKNASKKVKVALHKVSEGGHNLYIDNPFDTNELIRQIVERDSGSDSQSRR